MVVFALAFWIITALICIGEVIYERDWPRETFKFFVMPSVLMVMVFAG